MDQAPILAFDLPRQRVDHDEAPIVSPGQIFRVLLLAAVVLIGLAAVVRF